MEARQGLPTNPKVPTQATPPRPPVPPPFPAPCRPPQPPQPPQLPQLSFVTDRQPAAGGHPSPSAPPLPPKLPLGTHLPPRAPTPPQSAARDAPSAVEEQQVDKLPSYEGLQSKEPGNPRFGRWKGWIEKRAQERQEEREAVRAIGSDGRSGWDLPQDDGRPSIELTEGEDDRARDRRAEERLSRPSPNRPTIGITNPDSSSTSTPRSEAGPSAAMSPSSSLGAGRVVQRLTQSTSIHTLGSRFARGIEEQPRCGCVLPISTSPTAAGVERMERFLLVGTDEGLYLADLQPSLSSSTLHTAPQLDSEAAILPLWQQLGVLQLEVIVESDSASPGPSGGPVGIVVALVKLENGEVELRMWSLAVLNNLARWRVFNVSSTSLDLGTSPSNKASTTSPESNRSSKSYIKSFFTSSHDSKGKGKASATGSIAVPTPLRQSLEETEDRDGGFVVLDKTHRRDGSSASSADRAHSESSPRLLDHSRNASKTSVGLPSTSSSLHSCTLPPSPPTDNLALPLEWATSFVRLPLPPAKHSHSHSTASPILFFRLSRTPPSAPSPAAHERRDPSIRQQRSQREKEREARDKGAIWLVVATRGVVYLYQSEAGKEKRGWKLLREFYAPATPRRVSLARTSLPHSSASPPSVGLGRRISSKRESIDADPRIPSDLALLLGMKDRTVLINVMDSSVQEVDASSPSSGPTSLGSSLSPPSDSTLQGRSRSTTATSVSSTASASSALSAASSLRTRVVEATSGKVAALVEGKQSIPAGMREKGMEGKLAKSRKLGEGGAVPASEELGAGDWVGCETFALVSSPSDGRPTIKQYYILTRGSMSSIFASPLSSSSATSSPPLATFSFPLTSSAPLVHVQVLLRTRTLTPSAQQRSFVHLVILAWTKTGVHVKEGVVEPSAEQGEGAGRRWFTLLSSYKAGESPLQLDGSLGYGQPSDDDDELEHQASFDFGRDIVKVCEGGPWVAGRLPRRKGGRDGSSGSEDEDDGDEGGLARWRMMQEVEEAQRATRSGAFFFVRGVGDWGLRWIG